MGRRKGQWKCKFCGRIQHEAEEVCYHCKMYKFGCGKLIPFTGNFGIISQVKCGWTEEGFKPNLCYKCSEQIKQKEKDEKETQMPDL